MKLAIKLSEFEVSFEAWKALKAQMFADYLNELTFVPPEPYRTWVIFTDGSSNSQGSGAGVILENNSRLVVEDSLRL